jgi:hypothetical protein
MIILGQPYLKATAVVFQVPNVTPLNQENTLWCWAACGTMTANRFAAQTTQRVFVIETTGNSSAPNQTGTVDNVAEGINLLSKTLSPRTYTGAYFAFSYFALRDWIASGFPLSLALANMSGGSIGHMVLATSAWAFNGIGIIEYIDPEGAVIRANWHSELVNINGFNIGNTTYRYMQTAHPW